MKAWLVIAGGDRAMYAGNDGYHDEPSAYYSWDSKVPRHAELEVGDRIIVRDKKVLLGYGTIESIETGEDLKIRYKCPQCGRATMKLRKDVRPRYRCYSCSAEFDNRSERVETVTVYRAFYGSTWCGLEGVLSIDELREMCESPTSQHSIRSLRWNKFVSAIDRRPTHRASALADPS